MRRQALNALLYHPSRVVLRTPSAAGLRYEDLDLAASDGTRLHGWWIPAPGPGPRAGHVLFCHGNGGNIGDRVAHAALLARGGFDVLVFDYRGYGRSAGAPDEAGTHRDARAAREALLARRGVEPDRVIYLGESLGGAVAVALADEHPPARLILQAAFANLRDMARIHYPFIPAALVPDAYPSARRLASLHVPLLVLHGDRDEVVPLSQGRALFAAAAEPKTMRVFPGAGHDLLATVPGEEYLATIAAWLDG